MFQVFDNGKPADNKHFPVAACWNKSQYSSFEEAYEYAKDWLGHYAYSLEESIHKVDWKIPYGGCDDYIEIREVRER